MSCRACGENCGCGQRSFVDKTSQINGEDNHEREPVTDVHHVPFKVEYEGEANVDTKFTAKSVPLLSTDDKVLSNQFRGRPLQGQKMDLPKDYEGLVATDLKLLAASNGNGTEESKTNGHGKEKTEVVLEKRFDSLTYWNWDRVPSGMDKHVKLMDWLELSQIVHAPVDDL